MQMWNAKTVSIIYNPKSLSLKNMAESSNVKCKEIEFPNHSLDYELHFVFLVCISLLCFSVFLCVFQFVTVLLPGLLPAAVPSIQ